MIRLVFGICVLVLLGVTLVSCESAVPSATPIPPPTPTLIDGQYTYEEMVQVFEYDPQTPLDIQEISVAVKEDGVEVHDISYIGTLDHRVPAFLVVPPGEGPFAGVLFMHQGFGSRYSFLNEAIDLAKKGVVSLLVHHGTWRSADPDNYKRIVVSLRRGTDLLARRPDVDNNRLGYVGHSWGATFGGILADIDECFRTYILMAGGPSFSEAWDRDDLVPFDGVHYIRHAAPVPLLFQFANNDEWVSRQAAMEFFEAASEPKQIKWYDTTHAFESDEALQDRHEWLGTELGLP